jgi:hypothetical protein
MVTQNAHETMTGIQSSQDTLHAWIDLLARTGDSIAIVAGEYAQIDREISESVRNSVGEIRPGISMEVCEMQNLEAVESLREGVKFEADMFEYRTEGVVLSTGSESRKPQSDFEQHFEVVKPAVVWCSTASRPGFEIPFLNQFSFQSQVFHAGASVN